jgi:DNA uptake protein ComE-like DNA-binding protein
MESEWRGINVNEASETALREIPGIGPDTAHEIVARRPYRDWQEFREKLGSMADVLIDVLTRAGARLT